MTSGAIDLPGRKRINLDKLLLDTVKIVTKHPPHSLTYSKLSRFLKIPRSTLYYYFGKDVYNLLNESARFAMKKFTVLDKLQDYRTFPSWKEYQITRFHRVIEIIQKNPWAPRMYFRYRDDQTSIGAAIRKAEKEYLNFMKEVWMHFHNQKSFGDDSGFMAASLKLGFLWGISIGVSPGLNRPDPHPTKVHDALVKKLSSLIEDFLSE